MAKISDLFRKADLHPKKSLGQNFLVDPVILDRLVEAADLSSSDLVLEIGAGTGTLTKRLVQRAGHVIAVEIDQQMIPILQETLTDFENLTLVQGDILKLDPTELLSEASISPSISNGPYKVVANLPYYITSAVLRHLLEASRKPEWIVVTVQREVAERIIAEPGEMSTLSVSVQFYGDPKILFRIKPGSFYPSPNVESAVVRIDLHAEPPLPDKKTGLFFRMVRAGFSQRRKQLHNALSAGLGREVDKQDVIERLQETSVDYRRRAQTLTIPEWVEIMQALSDLVEESQG
jgi:16S rRNA (adenine1518-N6/adenine1519-N6)-dimethyltransferase